MFYIQLDLLWPLPATNSTAAVRPPRGESFAQLPASGSPRPIPICICAGYRKRARGNDRLDARESSEIQ